MPRRKVAVKVQDEDEAEPEEEGREEVYSVMKKHYYNNESGYLSAIKFHKRLRELGYAIPLYVVNEWLALQPSYTDTVTPKKPTVFNSVWADYVSQNYQMDTMYMRNYKDNGYQYILLVIDVHSRYLGAHPLRTKSGGEYTVAFENIINEQMDKLWPESLNADGEYIDNHFGELMEAHGVKLNLSALGQPYKNAVVERVIRTLRGILGRWRNGDPDGGVHWTTALPQLLRNYNNTFHRTLRHKPIEVWLGQKPNDQIVRWKSNSLGVGDRVRHLLRTGDKWTKVDTLRWSKDVYRIKKAKKSRWKLEGLNGEKVKDRYMEYELKLVPKEEVTRDNAARIQVNAQRANAAATRRIVKEDLGHVTHDIGGRPTFGQLLITEPRVRKKRKVHNVEKF